MKDEQGGPGLVAKIAIGLGLVALPALLIAPLWISATTDREPIWQLAMQLALFMVGGSLAVVVVLLLRDRAAARGETLRMNRWVALGLVAALAAATLAWRAGWP